MKLCLFICLISLSFISYAQIQLDCEDCKDSEKKELSEKIEAYQKWLMITPSKPLKISIKKNQAEFDGQFIYDEDGSTITINTDKKNKKTGALALTLLHEMTHWYAYEKAIQSKTAEEKLRVHYAYQLYITYGKKSELLRKIYQPLPEELDKEPEVLAKTTAINKAQLKEAKAELLRLENESKELWKPCKNAADWKAFRTGTDEMFADLLPGLFLNDIDLAGKKLDDPTRKFKDNEQLKNPEKASLIEHCNTGPTRKFLGEELSGLSAAIYSPEFLRNLYESLIDPSRLKECSRGEIKKSNDEMIEFIKNAKAIQSTK